MEIADDIAYSTYDLDDAFVAGFFSPVTMIAMDEDIKVAVAKKVKAKIDSEYGKVCNEEERRFEAKDLTDTLLRVFQGIFDSGARPRQMTPSEVGAGIITGESEQASQLLAKNEYGRNEFTAVRLFKLMNGVEIDDKEFPNNPALWRVRPSLKSFQEIETLKLINYEVLIRSDKFQAERHRARTILKGIFDALVKSGQDLLPNDWREIYRFYRSDENRKRRTICDFISGMTDRYCVEFYTRLFGTSPPSIHKP